MQRAKAFFLVCAGVFLLAFAYHLGVTSATAQVVSGNPVVGEAGNGVVVTANGDVYVSPVVGSGAASYGTWTREGNVFAGSGPTPVQPTTFGAIKAQYRR